MPTLNEQLEKAAAAERAEAERIAREQEPKGGPSGRPPGDRWIRYHLTRDAHVVAWGIVILILGSAAIVGFMAAAGTKWEFVKLIAVAAVLGSAVVLSIYAVVCARALPRTRQFVRSLSFDGSAYLDALREPPWRTKRGYYVSCRPSIVVTFVSVPPAETVEQLAKLIRRRRVVLPTRYLPESATLQLDHGSVEPFHWYRQVIEQVLVPLCEKYPITGIVLHMDRTIEEHTGGD